MEFYPKLSRLNVLNSKSIEEVKTLSCVEGNNVLPNVYDYYSNADLKYADEYSGPAIAYEINEYGFRSAAFPEEIDFAAFGCSFTFGLGLSENQVWHRQLVPSSYNFGVPGSSIESICDMFIILSTHLKIKTAVFLLPSYLRIQIASESENLHQLSVIPNHDSTLCEACGVDGRLLYKALPDSEIFKRTKNALYLVDYIAKVRNIKLYFGTWDNVDFLQNLQFTHATVLPNWYTPQSLNNDFARDKLHPGPEHHSFWADLIREKIDL